MEVVDVLDERGNYTGETATRDEAHKKGLYHKGVVLFILSEDNQRVLLQKRSLEKKNWPGLYDVSVGGHVDAGEFGYQALIREAKEELGLELKPHDFLFIGATTSHDESSGYNTNHFNEYYVINKEVEPNKLQYQVEEVEKAEWFEREKVREMIENNLDGLTEKEGCWKYLLRYLDSL